LKVIGTRHGEKLFETLLSREEMACAEDLGGYFRIPPDPRDLSYAKYIDHGELKISGCDDYNSHNTQRLNVSEMKKLLLGLSFIKSIVS
jgi:UDP-glucose 4-epimerase